MTTDSVEEIPAGLQRASIARLKLAGGINKSICTTSVIQFPRNR